MQIIFSYFYFVFETFHFQKQSLIKAFPQYKTNSFSSLNMSLVADPSRNSDSNEFGHLKINERSKLRTLV